MRCRLIIVVLLTLMVYQWVFLVRIPTDKLANVDTNVLINVLFEMIREDVPQCTGIILDRVMDEDDNKYSNVYYQCIEWGL